MYNLLVTYESGRWDASQYQYERERVFEFTTDSIFEKYKDLDAKVIEELMSLPSLFVYEESHGLDAHIGQIKHIKVTTRSVIIEYELDNTFPPIPISSLSDLKFKLDIENWELNRTHWAVKNKNLLDVLFEAGLIKQTGFRSLDVFLCYASDDQAKVKKLYKRLAKDGVNAWFDKEKLLPGQDWETEIHSAIRNSDVILACLSSRSVTKEGYLQKELRAALNVADEKPDQTIFIIPVRLEDCKVPEKLKRLQWVDLFLENGYEKLFKALQNRAIGL